MGGNWKEDNGEESPERGEKGRGLKRLKGKKGAKTKPEGCPKRKCKSCLNSQCPMGLQTCQKKAFSNECKNDCPDAVCDLKKLFKKPKVCKPCRKCLGKKCGKKEIEKIVTSECDNICSGVDIYTGKNDPEACKKCKKGAKFVCQDINCKAQCKCAPFR